MEYYTLWILTLGRTLQNFAFHNNVWLYGVPSNMLRKSTINLIPPFYLLGCHNLYFRSSHLIKLLLF